MVYLTSDLHIGHKNITKYRTPFASAEEHDDYMIEQILALTKHDLLFVLGDFVFASDKFEEHMQRILQTPARIKVVLGNHDNMKLLDYRSDKLTIMNPLASYKNMWLSHCPIHHEELRDRIGCVHGHLHLSKLNDKRYFNCNIDVNNYKFVKLDEIKEHFKTALDK